MEQYFHLVNLPRNMMLELEELNTHEYIKNLLINTILHL
jgi:hypothetical protein